MKPRRRLKIEGAPKNNETPMLEWYWWKEAGGTLCAEFPIVDRDIDAVILPKERHIEVGKNKFSELINGRDLVVVQAKAKPLSMYLMGQTLFSGLLIKRGYNPSSAHAVALCKEDDPILRPLLISIGKQVGVDIEVKAYSYDKLPRMSEGPGPGGTRMIERYWNQVGGALLYWNLRKKVNKGLHLPHALIVRGGPKAKKEVLGEDIAGGQDVIVVHAKAGGNKKGKYRPYRLGMYLMGQVLFGAELVRRKVNPRSIRSIALCEEDHSILHPLLKDIGRKVGIDMEVKLMPK